MAQRKKSIFKLASEKRVSNNSFVLKDLENRGEHFNKMEPVTSHESKIKSDAYSEDDKKVLGGVMGAWVVKVNVRCPTPLQKTSNQEY